MYVYPLPPKTYIVCEFLEFRYRAVACVQICFSNETFADLGYRLRRCWDVSLPTRSCFLIEQGHNTPSSGIDY